MDIIICYAVGSIVALQQKALRFESCSGDFLHIICV